jgi:hypothetical protein
MNANMRKLLLFIALFLVLVSCQESLEQRAQRTLHEYSEKNCPQQIGENIVLDSCAFEMDTHTLHYYYRFMGVMDNDSITGKAEAMRKLVLDAMRNETSTRVFKEAGYSFKYTYYSQKNVGKVLFETTITKADYE